MDTDSSSYDFNTAAELLILCEKEALSIAEVVLRRESFESGSSRDELVKTMRERYRKMKDSIRRGIQIDKLSASRLSGGDAARLMAYAESDAPLGGADFARTMAYGFAVLESNAQFGRIVATPTAGSAGVVPACLLHLEDQGLDEDTAVSALFTAAGIGLVIANNACFSGARGGCQAEIGSASCMAAAAIVEARGGTPRTAQSAASFALMNTLGLVCDPIGGYVEVPCVSRNGMFAVHSIQAAVMALAGCRCLVPLDDVVIAMRDIGRRMPRALKETSQGGLATTPTGQSYMPK
ncbi:L-serine ammonia-lyase, iron-sulfur-dependent, subunit alpha [Ruficoccus amylovorans]|uniref:L-serine dehydratase n=1 Tax=Ruficoccus amylovorans TaxID=1804625 RepID=A0A842HHR0_9BACT|nr:L-serine ammonia-lyase, iron-sulfur-dependent, subunit alpha [Ruficoccus amylovorans]MBC2595710.1 L-serine ammonia-lyase, iron-sulfur-dependent, subunit alpha [Ruficoccus amylovorans]